jgi:hypothetical protein
MVTSKVAERIRQNGSSVALSPNLMGGTFMLTCGAVDKTTTSVMLNRTELAALHAAAGELLTFYRDDGEEIASSFDPG